MLIRKPADIRSSEITSKGDYLNRRSFLAAGSAALGALAMPSGANATMKIDGIVKSQYSVSEKISSKDDATHYNNYYEFGTGKEEKAKYASIDLPYVEGLRLDEAMHPLALLAVGMYGETLPNQDGAPIRLIVPWKYGYKSAKSLVRIRLVEKQPPT